MKTLAFIAVLLLAALAPASAAMVDRSQTGNDIVGTILGVDGLATVAMPGANPSAAVVNMVVHPQDVITTGPRARVFIQLIDNTELTLGEQGQMTIDDYAFDEQDNTRNRAVYTFVKGAFLYVSGLIAKKENPDVTVNIPYGSIGIRGTKFWGGMIDDDYGIIVGEGAVEVKTAAGATTLTKGQATTLVDKSAPPGRPENWAKDKIDRATATVTLKAPDVIGERMKQNAERNQLLRTRHREILELREEKTLLKEQGVIDNNSTFQSEAEIHEKVQELKKEQAQKLGTTVKSKLDNVTTAVTAPDAAATTTITKTVTDTAKTIVNNVVSDQPAASVTPLSETLRNTVDGSKVNTSIIHATPMRRAPTESAVENAVQDSGNTATGTVKETVEKTTDTLKSGARALLNNKSE